MKKSKLVLTAIFLGIICICLISFVGIYVQKTNKMENIVKDYSLSKDLKGYREIILKVSDANKVLDENKKVIGDTDSYDDDAIKTNKYTKSEEKVNSEEIRTRENYELAKNIIEKRLKNMGVPDFNVGLDKNTGIIYLRVPEASYTDKIVSNITETGEVEIKDSEDETLIIGKERFKKATRLFNSQSNGTSVILELQFDKEGKEILKNISENDYKKLPEKSETEKDESSENQEESKEDNKEDSKEENKDEKKEDSDKENKEEDKKEEEKQKEVALYMSGDKTITTSFEEPLTEGKIYLNMGSATTDATKLAEYAESASRIAVTLNNGILPLQYNVDQNRYIKTNISYQTIRNVIIGVCVVIGLALVYCIIKFKLKGLFAAICYAGFIALYLLTLRFTNVVIALEGIVGIIIISALNYAFIFSMLNKNKEYKEELIKILPILAISIVFCYTAWTPLMSLGMTTFWGLVIMAIYNWIITKYVID